MTIKDKLKNKKFKNLTVIALVVIVIGACAAYKFTASSPADLSPAAGAPGGAGGAPATKVEATKAVKELLTQEAKLVGNLTSNESVVVSSEIAGRVVSIPFKEGTEVEAGHILFKLDDSVQKAELARAEANYNLAVNNNTRYSGLVETGAISKVQLDQATADLNLAKANIEYARANLAKTTIRAPFKGIAGIRQVSVGDVVSNGQNLVNFEQMSPIRVQFSAPEKYLSQLKTGTQISIKSESQKDPIAAEIFAIDPKIDQTTRNVMMQATTPNKDNLLFPGQFVSVLLPLGEGAEAITIPDQALIPAGSVITVYTVVDGKAKKNEVKVGTRANSKAQILEGINEGDVVITAGHQKIGDGAPVNVTEPTKVTVAPASEEDETTLKE